MTTRASGACSSPPSPRPMRHRHQAEHRGDRRHQNRAQTRAAAELDGLAQRHAVAPAQRVDVVHQQDGVADDDAGQHDDADVGLHAEGGAGQQQAQHDADRRHRNREHDDERVAQRLVLRRHHRVDEQHGEDQHELQLLERLGLLLDLGAEADREVRRHANLAEARLHGRDRLAERDLGLGVDARDALHVLAIDLHRTGLAVDGHHVLRRHDLAARRAEQHVADVGDLPRDRPRAAGRRSDTRCRARGTAPPWCRRRWSESWWRRPAPSGRAWRPSADRRGSRFPAGLLRGRRGRRRCPACPPSRRARPARCGARRRGRGRGSRAPGGRPLLPPPPSSRCSWKLPPAGLARTMTPGRPASCAPQVLRDLFVRARALVARHELDADLAAVGLAAAAATAAAVVAAAAAVGDDRRRLGHVLLDHLLELQQRFLGALDARADAELGVDVDLALVGLRQQLDADPAGRAPRRATTSAPRAPITVGRCLSATWMTLR